MWAMSRKPPMLFLAALAPLACQAPSPQPLAIPLQCESAECPLLTGAPRTAGMRSGLVRLDPGQSVGWHSTRRNEESLVILRGEGTALLDGHPARTFAAPHFLYIPPGTRHNVENTGHDLLEYVYVVAPAAAKQADTLLFPQTNSL